MKLKTIQRALTLLSVTILVALVWRVRSDSSVLPGALYLVVATYPALFGVYFAAPLLSKQRRGAPAPEAWTSHLRAYVLVLAGWQVCIVGLLNLWPFDFAERSQFALGVGYALAALFVVISYKLVAIADSENQQGGTKFISFFGHPRSRRLFFCALLYSPIGPVVLLSWILSDARWCPILLRFPQIWFLLTALLSAMSAGFIFQRYRGVANEAVDKNWEKGVLLATLFTIVLATGVQLFVGYDVSMYFLSSITVVCIGLSLYWLSRAGEGTGPSILKAGDPAE